MSCKAQASEFQAMNMTITPLSSKLWRGCTHITEVEYLQLSTSTTPFIQQMTLADLTHYLCAHAVYQLYNNQ